MQKVGVGVVVTADRRVVGLHRQSALVVVTAVSCDMFAENFGGSCWRIKAVDGLIDVRIQTPDEIGIRRYDRECIIIDLGDGKNPIKISWQSPRNSNSIASLESVSCSCNVIFWFVQIVPVGKEVRDRD